jgi:predicted transcriptional regulator
MTYGGLEDCLAENTLRLTTEIVAAYVQRNSVSSDALPALIRSVEAALQNPNGEAETPPTASRPSSAQIRRSIRADGLVSFEDGKAYKQLKRHLGTHGLTPQAYREKWGLPADYPMVAPSYSARRSELAKAAGLGTKTRRATATRRPKAKS